MKIVTVICTARFWLALMLSATFGMGAAAADIHPVDAEEIACMSADAETHHAVELIDAGSDDSEQRPDHKHHKHSCGPCHLHMVGVNGLTFSYALSITSGLRPGADQHVPRAGPDGLYRPPRA
mmetsp:Transcript_19117/g.24746  ORF Transcript_19117/g.24746 Transcript_19117/m.24746 type:complete len:123 (+) Transcript_19117:707-1075(+)